MYSEQSPPRPASSDLADRQQAARWFFERAHELQLRNELDQAILCYKKSLELHPTAKAHTFLGWIYGAKGRYEEAIRECERAITLDPELGNPYNDIGAYLIELNRPLEAISWLEKAASARRYEARHFPHVNLGRVYEQLGRWQNAMAAYARALRLNPADLFARQALNRLTALSN